MCLDIYLTIDMTESEVFLKHLYLAMGYTKKKKAEKNTFFQTTLITKVTANIKFMVSYRSKDPFS